MDYQPAPEQEAGYKGVNFPLLSSADHTCAYGHESDPRFDTFADESFEQFINRHSLSYCSAFDALIGDKSSPYANMGFTRLYWFWDCCSMGGSYRTLVMITTWPVLRLKTEAELNADLAACDRLISAIKNEACHGTQQR